MLLRPHLDVTTTRGLLLVAGDSVCLVKARCLLLPSAEVL